MILDELSHLVDRLDAVQIAVFLGVAPGEQPVAAEQHAVASGMRGHGAPQHHAELETRPLPWQPDHAPAKSRVELRQLAFAVGARGQGDAPVGMQVIDMVERQEGVQRRVDRGGHPVLAERAQRVERHHRVFMRFTTVPGDQLLELLEIQHGKARRANRSQIPAAALHREHAHRLSGQRIRQREFRAGIAAAKVGDAEIGAKQVGSVTEDLERIRRQPGGLRLVPEIAQVLGGCRGHLRHK